MKPIEKSDVGNRSGVRSNQFKERGHDPRRLARIPAPEDHDRVVHRGCILHGDATKRAPLHLAGHGGSRHEPRPRPPAPRSPIPFLPTPPPNPPYLPPPPIN